MTSCARVKQKHTRVRKFVINSKKLLKNTLFKIAITLQNVRWPPIFFSYSNRVWVANVTSYPTDAYYTLWRHDIVIWIQKIGFKLISKHFPYLIACNSVTINPFSPRFQYVLPQTFLFLFWSFSFHLDEGFMVKTLVKGHMSKFRLFTCYVYGDKLCVQSWTNMPMFFWPYLAYNLCICAVNLVWCSWVYNLSNHVICILIRGRDHTIIRFTM